VTLHQFLIFVRNREGRLARVTDLIPEVIQTWVDDMAAADLALSTMRARQSMLSSLCAWLVKRHLIAANPVSFIDRPPHRRDVPRQVPGPAIVDALVEAAKQRRPRDVAVFSILRYTSMRRESVATLRMCHLDGEWGLRRVPVKGGKTQDIPLPPVVMQFLHVYVERVLVTQMEKVGPDAPLFWSTWGRRAGGKTRAPMAGKNIWRLCKVYGRIIGFPELKPHTTFERAALDFLDEQTRRPDLRLDMDLQPGDIHLINNYTIHSRTGFIDGPEPDQRRHMLRLWLKFPTVWPLSAEFPAHMGYKPSEDTPVLVEAET